ncbi:transmembrane protein, putative (macronuclear) [Tetrahymena thermophila SB210]|uniref:Transmembrane protein, putative n=1 Tax=Tetrahymena thermophila (strain SB210) TaxID=312017 RepID=I7MK69_TETTS|nr:transmembrane protein, putative [Tetrahymena thermophila SB210]EAS07901.2 transmembrane protein, putative [Tetrahymena thermophila SB210]|eukprot:XP_001028143.2 transmembrane protein, putative [Tetrahymena thermophila SB210]
MYQNIQGECKACPSNCEICYGALQEISHDQNNDLYMQGYQVEQVYCVKCKNNFFYDYLNQKCVGQCKEGMRLNKIAKICELCKIEHCSNCNSDVNQCDLCNQSYIKQGSQCIPNQEQLIIQERQILNYYENSQECQEFQGQNSNGNCFSEVQNCPILQNSLYNQDQKYQMYFLDQEGNSIYIFTTNSVQKYSFPELVLIKEKQFQRREIIPSCGALLEINQFLFCTMNQSSIIQIDRETLAINLVYKFEDSFFSGDYMQDWEQGKICAILGSNNGISLFDLKTNTTFSIVRDNFMNAFIGRGSYLFLYTGSIAVNRLFIFNYEDKNQKEDVLLVSQNYTIQTCGYIQNILHVQNEKYILAGYLKFQLCIWNFQNITSIQINSCQDLNIPTFQQYSFFSQLFQWQNQADLYILQSRQSQKIMIFSLLDNFQIVYEFPGNISGIQIYDNYLIILQSNGVIQKYQVCKVFSSYNLKLIEESYSIGISGLNTQFLGINFVDRTNLQTCVLNPQDKLHCSSLILIVNVQEIILINMTNQAYYIENTSLNDNSINRHDQDISRFIKSNFFFIEKQIGLTDYTTLDSPLFEYTLQKEKETKLVIQKYLIRAQYKYNIQKQIMISRLDQSGGFVIDCEYIQEQDMLFLFHQTGLIAIELVQYITIFKYDIRDLYPNYTFTKTKKQKIRQDTYAVTLYDKTQKYAFTLLLQIDQSSVQQIGFYKDKDYIDFVLNEEEFTMIKMNIDNEYSYRWLNFVDFKIKKGIFKEKKQSIKYVQIVPEQKVIAYTKQNTVFLFSYQNQTLFKRELNYNIQDQSIQFSSYRGQQNKVLLYLYFQDYVFVHDLLKEQQNIPKKFACEGEKKLDSSKNKNQNYDFLITNQQQICIFDKSSDAVKLQKISLKLNVQNIDFFYFKKDQNAQGIAVNQDIDVIAVICNLGTYLFENINNMYQQFFFTQYICDKVKYLSDRELVCQQFNGKAYKFPLQKQILKNELKFEQIINDVVHLPENNLLIFKLNEKVIVRKVNINNQHDEINYTNSDIEKYQIDVGIIDDSDLQHSESESEEEEEEEAKKRDMNIPDDQQKTQNFNRGAFNKNEDHKIDLIKQDSFNGYYYDQNLNKLILVGKDNIKLIIQFDINGEPIEILGLFNDNYNLISVFQDQNGILFHNPNNGLENQIEFTPSHIFVRDNDKQIILFNQMDIIILNTDMIFFDYVRFQEYMDTFQVFFLEQYSTFILSPLSQSSLYILKFCAGVDKMWETDNYTISVVNLQYNIYNIKVDYSLLKIAVVTQNSMLQIINFDFVASYCSNQQQYYQKNLILRSQQKPPINSPLERRNENQNDINLDDDKKQTLFYLHEEHTQDQFNLTELLEDIVKAPEEDDEQTLRSDKIILEMVYSQDIIIIAFSNNLYVYSISKKRCIYIARNSPSKLKKIMIVNQQLIVGYNQQTFYFWSLENIIKYCYLQTRIASRVISNNFIAYINEKQGKDSTFSYFDYQSNQLFLVNSYSGDVLKRIQLKLDVLFVNYFYDTKYTRQRYENPSRRIQFPSFNCKGEQQSQTCTQGEQFLFVKQGYSLLVFNRNLELIKTIEVPSILTQMIAQYNQTAYFLTHLYSFVSISIGSSQFKLIIKFNPQVLLLSNINQEYYESHPFINFLDFENNSIQTFDMMTKKIYSIPLNNKIQKDSLMLITQNYQIAPNIYTIITNKNEIIFLKQSQQNQTDFLIKVFYLDFNLKFDTFYYDDYYQRIFILSFSSSSFYLASYANLTEASAFSITFPQYSLPSYVNNQFYITQDSQYYIVFSDWAIDVYIAKNMQLRTKIRQVLGYSLIKQVDMIGNDLLMIASDTEVIISVIHLSQSFVLFRLPFSMPQIVFSEQSYLQQYPRKIISIKLHILSGKGYTIAQFEVDPSKIDCQTFKTGVFNEKNKQNSDCILQFDLFYTAQNKQIIQKLVSSINFFNQLSSLNYQITHLKINLPSDDPNYINKLNSSKKDANLINYESVVISSKNKQKGQLLIDNKTALGNLNGMCIRVLNVTFIFEDQNNQSQQQQSDDILISNQILFVYDKTTLSFNEIQFIGSTEGFSIVYFNITEIFYVNQAQFINFHALSSNQTEQQSDQESPQTNSFIYIKKAQFVQINNISFQNVTCENDKINLITIEESKEAEIKNLQIREIYGSYLQILVIRDVDKLIISDVLIENIQLESFNLAEIEKIEYLEIRNLTIRHFMIKQPSIIDNKQSQKQVNNKNGDIEFVSQMQNLQIFRIESETIHFLNMEVQNSLFQGFLMQLGSQNVEITDLFITSNNWVQPKYLQILIQSSNVYLQNLQIINNTNIFIDLYGIKHFQATQIITKYNKYTQDAQRGIFNILESQQIILNESKFYNNILSDERSSLFILKNIFEIIFLNSEFVNNLSNLSSGGVIKVTQQISFLELYNNQENSFNINNCTFINNQAPQGSGGALFIQDTNLKIQNSTFIENKAQIGGAIRIKSTVIPPEQYHDFMSNISNNTFINNQAYIYGQNIGFSPQKLIFLNKEVNQLLENKEVFDFRSGSYLPLIHLQYLDNEGNAVVFPNSNSLISQEIAQEIKQYQVISYQQDASPNTSVLTFSLLHPQAQNSITVNASLAIEPNSRGKLVLYSQAEFYFVKKLNSSEPAFITKEILKAEITIFARQCIRGEIYSKINGIFFCEQCPEGKYSFNYPLKNESQSNICKVCPQEAVSCQLDQVNIKNGFWKEDQYSEEIYQCHYNSQNCLAEDKHSQQYCSQGYIGPLCSSCDNKGILWGNKYARQFEGVCSKCDQGTQHIVVLVLFVLLSLVYFIFIVKQSQTCTVKKITVIFLKKMRIISMGKSSQFERSSVISKILMSYIQILLIIVTSSQRFQIPNALRVLQFSGDPVINVFYSLDCMLSMYNVQIVFLRIIWVFFFTFCILIASNSLFIFQYLTAKSKSREISQYIPYFHMASKIVLIYSFPSILNQLVKVLTCIKYGTKTYCLSDLQFDCSEPQFIHYQRVMIIPLLAFIVALPLFFFWRAKRIYTRMNQDIRILKSFGFLFYGYKPNAYYWEILKLGFKGIQIILITMYHELHLTKFLLVLIVLIIYMQIQQKVKPYENQEFNQLEFQSHLVCSLTLISIMINLTTDVEWQIYLSILIIVISNLFFVISLVSHYFHGYKIPLNPKNRNLLEHILFFTSKYIPYFFSWVQVQKEYSFKILLLWHKLSLHIQQKKEELVSHSAASSYSEIKQNLDKIKIQKCQTSDIQDNKFLFLKSNEQHSTPHSQKGLLKIGDKQNGIKKIRIIEDIGQQNNFHNLRLHTETQSRVNFVIDNQDPTFEKSIIKMNIDQDSQIDLTSPSKLLSIAAGRNLSVNNSMLSYKSNMNSNETYNNNSFNFKINPSTSYIQNQIKINRKKKKNFSLKQMPSKCLQKDSFQSNSQFQDSSKILNLQNEPNMVKSQIQQQIQLKLLELPQIQQHFWSSLVTPQENVEQDSKLFFYNSDAPSPFFQQQLNKDQQFLQIETQQNQQKDQEKINKQNQGSVQIEDQYSQEKDENDVDLNKITMDSYTIERSTNIQIHNLPISSNQVYSIQKLNEKVIDQI